MTPYHITTKNAAHAAIACCNVLERVTAPWLIWSAGDEGYLMAPATSRVAQNVRRYFPESIAGEYKRPDRKLINAALVDAKERQSAKNPCRNDERREWERKYKAMRRSMGMAA